MKHSYSGIIAAARLHTRSAAIHQKAIAHRALSEFGGQKNQVDDLVGPYLRAKQTHDILHDVSVDAEIAKRILNGSAHPEQEPLMEFTQLAFAVKGADMPRREAALAAVTSVADSLAAALAENAQVLKEVLVDAKQALVKAVAANGLNTQSLRAKSNVGLQLLEGTVAHKSLPRELLTGVGGLTAQGEQRLAENVSKDYLRELEDEQILRDEFTEHDKKAAKLALQNRAKVALANLGVN